MTKTPLRRTILPGPSALTALAVSVGILGVITLIGARPALTLVLAAGLMLMLTAVMAWDCATLRREWTDAAPTMVRRLPPAFAIGVRRDVQLCIDVAGDAVWSVDLYDHTDATLSTEGLPAHVTVKGGTRIEVGYSVVPTSRGAVTFAPADARVRSRWGWCEVLVRLGSTDRRRVYPDFSQISRYAWLAGDRRLREIGVKAYRLRGQGTDFKQLAEYQAGDSIRHVDWRATLRMAKPVVRQFQDERDQCVMLLVDCGRRMRADDRSAVGGSTHFDQVLNAVMLLAYVALKHGDAVGAMTFGTPRGGERAVLPRKGPRALNALMSQLYDVQPTLAHSDYLAAAEQLLSRRHRRSLVILVTNFRDEDGSELGRAIGLLRPRHVVLLASLRERIIEELQSVPLTGTEAVIEVASAHLYDQTRRDAFNRLSTGASVVIDAVPERLGVELVNGYHALKGAGAI